MYIAPDKLITPKKRYSTFTAVRWEYWASLFALYCLSSAIEVSVIHSTDPNTLYLGAFTIFLCTGAMFVITIARCRDAGLNGWWAFATFIPLGFIYFGCIRSDDHPKKLRAFEKLRVHDEEKLI